MKPWIKEIARFHNLDPTDFNEIPNFQHCFVPIQRHYFDVLLRIQIAAHVFTSLTRNNYFVINNSVYLL